MSSVARERHLVLGQQIMGISTAPKLRIQLALLAWLLTVPLAQAAPLADDWQERAGKRLALPSEADVAAARARFEAALGNATKHLSQLPEGGPLGVKLRFGELYQQLDRDAPDPAVVRGLVEALRIKRPGELPALLAELRASLEAWHAIENMDDAALARARENVALLAAWSASPNSSQEAETSLRSAFRELARTHLLSAELEEFKAAFSQPNQQVHVSAGFLRQIAAREFTAPIDVRERRDGATITADGALPIRTRLALPTSDGEAQLQLLVEARGPVSLRACRKKLRLSACSQLCLDGAQDYFIGATGVRHEDPRLALSSRTRLTGVNANVRIGDRLVERVVANAAAKRLPAADRQATRAAKPAIAARVKEECEDIALRINGLFQGLYLMPLAAEDVDPASHFRSSPEGIDWNATYARHDQLGALDEPPAPRVPAAQLSYTTSLHESAVNNLAEQLAGTWIDEATYWMILLEEFKLQSPEVDSLPPGRRATALRFSDNAPLSIRVDDSKIHLSIGVVQWALQADAPSSAVVTRIEATYRIEPGADGVRLVRDGEIQVTPAADEALRTVLARYFPSELHPRRKFPNAAAPRRMMVRELNFDDGWLVIGTGPVAEPTVADKKREASR
jgi:hypothetical protein